MINATKTDVPTLRTSPQPTALSSTLPASIPLIHFAGSQTPAEFKPIEQELNMLLRGCCVFDLGWRAQIAVRGEDRLRWLSGMVTNAVQQLGEGEGNYSFFLNAQGRIQGDAFVYRSEDQLLLDTTFDQVEPLMAHLDRFIIMDDVNLSDPRAQYSVLGIAGPQAEKLLTEVGLILAEVDILNTIRICHVNHGGMDLVIVTHPGILTPQFEIICNVDHVDSLWQQLLDAGAQPCGVRAIEGLRILEGLPRYGVDIADRDLPQETGQTRALNFSKGCYLGQEIVERIRSRGAVHRELRQFSLEGQVPSLPTDLSAEGKVIGAITSAVSLATASGPAVYALGIVRSDAVIKVDSLTYNGGKASALDHTPAMPSF